VTILDIEINGFDESGLIGKYLRFIRVGIEINNALRPFVYNLLHFRSVGVTKRFLRGISDDIKVDYVRKILSDPSISVSQYTFSPDHQLDVLRQFTLLEEITLFHQRGILLSGLEYDNAKGVLEDHIQYLRRYERAPYWMEAFIKSYGFRMAIQDLANTSKVLSDPRAVDYKVVSYVDGGFPFVFWWRSFLLTQLPPSRFNLGRTPIYGVTKGDEYYPVTSMAGNIAFITSNIPGMIYPHTILELPKMSFPDLRGFYSEFSERVGTPTFQKRVLFAGYLPRDFQYTLPYILHVKDSYLNVYEPFRLNWEPQGTLKSFYRTFGRYPENDLVILGPAQSDEDKQIIQECKDYGLKCHDCGEFVKDYLGLLDDIEVESTVSNLNREQVSRIKSVIEKSRDFVKKMQ